VEVEHGLGGDVHKTGAAGKDLIRDARLEGNQGIRATMGDTDL
jgi:hypothetical protein